MSNTEPLMDAKDGHTVACCLDKPLVCVEHPGVVVNIAKAIDTLGGAYQVDQFLHSQNEKKSLGLSWRPNDPLAKRIPSRCAEVNSMLLKITVPKLTGRKRKRGSSDTFEFDDSFKQRREATVKSNKARFDNLLLGLQAESVPPKIFVMGSITETYRFRDIPDFQFALIDDMSNMIRMMLKENYSKWKDIKPQFDVDKNYLSIAPPLISGRVTIPSNFSYMQNKAMKNFVGKDGKIETVNRQMAMKSQLIYCSPDAKSLPTESPSGLQPEESLDPLIRETIGNLRSIMKERPIVTRRVIVNLMPEYVDGRLRIAYPYVGYTFRKGPWKDAIVRYGVNPRSDPVYRFYQTVLFKLTTSEEGRAEKVGKSKQLQPDTRLHQDEKDSHIFDGKLLRRDGKIWQVCDIEDPLLKEILNANEIRSECEPYRDGWYHSGTWAKFRSVMRDKLDVLLEGKIPNDTAYRRIMNFPDLINRDNVQSAVFTRAQRPTEKELNISNFIRSWARQQFADDAGANINENPVVGEAEEDQSMMDVDKDDGIALAEDINIDYMDVDQGSEDSEDNTDQQSDPDRDDDNQSGPADEEANEGD